MTKGARLGALLGAVAVACALIAYYIVSYVANTPPAVQAAERGRVVNLTFETVAAYGHSPHPDWVTYLVKNEQGQWVHSTIVDLPAHALVHVTVLNYDGDSGLRNPFWGKPQGIVPGSYTINGKPTKGLGADLASHTFAIPDLHVSVPIQGVADDAPNQCDQPTPCAGVHKVIRFAFRTGKPGHYRWQCFVPCAAGFQNGFGGPMQTVGWMDGYLNVS
jgi:hypothetical protein